VINFPANIVYKKVNRSIKNTIYFYAKHFLDKNKKTAMIYEPVSQTKIANLFTKTRSSLYRWFYNLQWFAQFAYKTPSNKFAILFAK